MADHDDLLDGHLVELSELGQEQLDDEDFEGTEATFREIIRLDAAMATRRNSDRRPGRAALPQRKKCT